MIMISLMSLGLDFAAYLVSPLLDNVILIDSLVIMHSRRTFIPFQNEAEAAMIS